jgi:Alpha/beta hydrolase domain
MPDAVPPLPQAGIDALRLQPAQPAFAGRSFGEVGAYEWVVGTAFCSVDPAQLRNRGIALLDRAPRDWRGFVTYDVDLSILRPVDPACGNGWLLYDVLNRGTKRAIHRINSGVESNTPTSEAEAGTGFLMRRGFTMVWSGWQADLPAGLMSARLPIATAAEEKLTRLSREEFILDLSAPKRADGITELSATRFVYQLSYPAAEIADGSATLTIRQNEADARIAVPRAQWRYLNPCRIEITHDLPAAFDRGAIWEFIYRAGEPVVTGLALASMRDIVAFLRRGTADVAGQPNPLAGRCRHAVGFGLSQSGRVLRDFLYEGFNVDLDGRPVFEAMMPVIAGSRRSFLNFPFAQPGRFPRQHEDHSFPGDQFPFTYGVQIDAISGRRDGILAQAEADGVAPKIMHIDSESEIFSARSSLVVTDTIGGDIALPENVRVYIANGVAHGDYPLSPAIARTAGNTLTYGPLARALLPALCRWVETGTLPPPSRYPTRATGTLVTLAEAARAFPQLPQTGFPDRLNRLHLLDHNKQPPEAWGEYPVFLGVTDEDGNGRGGVLHPLLAAPLGTHTGWQLRRPSFAPGELLNVFGAFIPFATTRAARETTCDPRPSLEERYGNAAGWHAALAAALPALVADGFLLEEDAERILARAGDGYPAALNFS